MASATAASKETSPFAVPELDGSVDGPPTPTASTSTTFVLFHSPCPDGAFAALAAWLHLSEGGDKADERGRVEGVTFVPHRVFESLQPPTPTAASTAGPLSSLSERDTVYLLDYSGPAGFPQGLARVAGRVVVLDHHKTAAEQLAPVVAAGAWKEKRNKSEERDAAAPASSGDVDPPRNLEVLIDQERSGATIAAAHFAPRLTGGQERAFAAIEDGDLWRWTIPTSKAFYAGLHSSGIFSASSSGGGGGAAEGKREGEGQTPEEMLLRLSRLDFEETVAKGEKIVEERDREVSRIAGGAFEVELRGPEGGTGASGGAKATTASPPAEANVVASSFGRALAVEVAPEQAGLRSQLGNVLAAIAKERGEREGGEGRMRAVGVVAYREPGMIERGRDSESLIKISVRSIGEGEDTSPLSQAHGGGGHRNASSFLMPAEEFRRWRVSK